MRSVDNNDANLGPETPKRAASPAPSTYTFHSSVDGKTLLRDCHGRVLNSLNELYMWPADDEERKRLDLQHEHYKHCIGGLYAPQKLVQDTLAPRDADAPQPAIIDIGTGSGSWAIDMAMEFPHCEVVGIDLAPMVVKAIPPNCRFEIDDVNLGLPHYENKFNVIHARAIGGGIRDFPKLHREFANVLRPGGVLLMADGDLQLLGEDGEPAQLQEEGEPGFSWTVRVFFTSYNIMKGRGANVDSPSLNPGWLKHIEQFEDIENIQMNVPIGPWRDDPREILVAEMNRTNVVMHVRGMKPLLLSAGYFENVVEHMITQAELELRELRVHLFTRWHFTWATRNLKPNLVNFDTSLDMQL